MLQRLIAAAILLMTALATPAGAQSRFDGWAVAIVAGDWRGGNQPIEAFDNARRDLVQGFLDAGFSRDTMVDYSLRPDVPNPTTAQQALAGITEVTGRATRGCLLYFTSHGSPAGIVFGPSMTLAPADMARLVRGWCGDRPTVVVMSACYSGVFKEALSGPNRIVMTAASRVTSSFGCGADSKYPYFDGCVLESLPKASDFLTLSHATRACVTRRETEENLTPPSEPQVFIGANMQLMAPTLRFNRPPS
ncbi:MAG: C13 family peptidase [Brevundimonas sp.]